MVKRSNMKPPLTKWTLATIVIVVCLAAEASLAAMVIGKAKRSWGTVTVKRGGSDIPFVDGMDLEDGDEIRTGRHSGAVYELFGSHGLAVVEEEIFGLAGPKGCADAPGEKGEGKVILRAKNRGGKKRIVTEVKKGTTRTKTILGEEEMAKDHEVVTKKAVARKKGTDYALSYDLDLDQASLSTLDGQMEFDNIEYSALPDPYFTDPFNKSAETLDLALVLNYTTETIGVFDLLAAGNAVEVNGSFFSIVASPPSPPAAGLAPIHGVPGGLSPEPASMSMLALGGLALLRRRKK